MEYTAALPPSSRTEKRNKYISYVLISSNHFSFCFSTSILFSLIFVSFSCYHLTDIDELDGILHSFFYFGFGWPLTSGHHYDTRTINYQRRREKLWSRCLHTIAPIIDDQIRVKMYATFCIHGES